MYNRCKSTISLVVRKVEEMATTLDEDQSFHHQSGCSKHGQILTSQVQSNPETCSECTLNTTCTQGQERHGRFYSKDGVPRENTQEACLSGVNEFAVALLPCTSCCVRQKSEYRTPMYKMSEDVFHIGVFKARYMNKKIFYQWKRISCLCANENAVYRWRFFSGSFSFENWRGVLSSMYFKQKNGKHIQTAKS